MITPAKGNVRQAGAEGEHLHEVTFLDRNAGKGCSSLDDLFHACDIPYSAQSQAVHIQKQADFSDHILPEFLHKEAFMAG